MPEVMRERFPVIFLMRGFREVYPDDELHRVPHYRLAINVEAQATSAYKRFPLHNTKKIDRSTRKVSGSTEENANQN